MITIQKRVDKRKPIASLATGTICKWKEDYFMITRSDLDNITRLIKLTTGESFSLFELSLVVTPIEDATLIIQE